MDFVVYIDFKEKNILDPACIGATSETQRFCLSTLNMVALTVNFNFPSSSLKQQRSSHR